jgi:predicted O-methyltransferase YrrM
MPDFDSAWAAAQGIPGWLTRAQSRTLFDAVVDLPDGSRVLEIGSHLGRSTVVLADALPRDGVLTAVDPFKATWRYGLPDTQSRFREHLRLAGVADAVEIRAATSAAVRRDWAAPLAVVYVDGKHDYWTVRDDLRWGEFVIPGGWILVHDAFSSVGVTTALLRELLVSRSLRYAGRTGSLARLQVEPPSRRDRLRPLAELPWWVRNLSVKVTLRLRLRLLTRMLGHKGEADPY